jgi:hypothetical protein
MNGQEAIVMVLYEKKEVMNQINTWMRMMEAVE